MKLLHGRSDRIAEKENLYAFLLALFSPVYLTPEKAFEYLKSGVNAGVILYKNAD